MATSTSVAQYLAQLPADRRAAIAAVRDTINANLPAGYVEGIQYGMIGWCVPLSRYPDTYNGQPLGLAALASQKQHMALYLMSVYGDPALEAWFKRAYAASGKPLDMGKSCVRFKSLDALPLDVIAEAIRKVPVDAFLACYEAVKRPANGKAKPKARAARAATKRAKPARAKPQAKRNAKPK